jgi:hypothetical protein
LIAWLTQSASEAFTPEEGLDENDPRQFDSDLIASIAALALACGWLSALSSARVSSNPGAAVAPASAQTTRSTPAAEKLDINTAPNDQLKTSRHRPAARIAPSWIWCTKTPFSPGSLGQNLKRNHREAAEGHRDGPGFPK